MVFLTNQERTREIILQLKQIKAERDLSLQDIHDMVIECGEFTSLSSIKRVFAEGSENQNFRYQDTIQPITRALLGVNEGATALAPTEADTLKNVTLLKDAIIRDLRNENEELQLQLREQDLKHKEMLVEFKAEAQKMNEYLLKEHERKDKIVIRRNRIIALLAVLFGLFMFAVIVVLLIDITNPNIGWFRYANLMP